MKVQIVVKQTLEKIIEVDAPDTCTEGEIIEAVDDMFCNDEIELKMEDYKGDYSIAVTLFEYTGKTEKYKASDDNGCCVLEKEK